jgi:hypothetical protein
LLEKLTGFTWDETLGLYPKLVTARSQLNLPFFAEIVLIASWELNWLSKDAA